MLAELAHDDREEHRRGREVEAAVHPHAGGLVELVERLAQRLVDRRVVEHPRHVADLVEELVEDGRVGLAPRELLDGVLRLRAELLVGVVRARHADEVEALGQRALVGEVVERRQQLALGQVAGRAEDDQRRGVDRQPLEPLDEGVVGALGDGAHSEPPQALGQRSQRRGRIVALERHALGRAGRAPAASRGRRSPARA